MRPMRSFLLALSLATCAALRAAIPSPRAAVALRVARGGANATCVAPESKGELLEGGSGSGSLKERIMEVVDRLFRFAHRSPRSGARPVQLAQTAHAIRTDYRTFPR